MSHTYLTKDLCSFLILFHIHGAKSDPWATFGEGVVVRFVFILWCGKSTIKKEQYYFKN